MSRSLDRLLDRAADRVADRVAARLEGQYQSYLATIDVMTDPELVADLRAADDGSDDDARPYEEIRRELGLA